MENHIDFGPGTVIAAYCGIREKRHSDPELVFIDTENPDREIRFKHARPDGPALERRLKQSLMQLIPLHPELLEPPASIIFSARHVDRGPDGTVTMTCDRSFRYDLRLTLCDANLPEPGGMKENLGSDCVYATPGADLSRFELVCNHDTRGPGKITPAGCNACRNYRSRHIQFPITIADIVTNPCKPEHLGHEPGALVAVRPADEERTYLGIYVGDLPMFVSSSYDRKCRTLNVTPVRNPAMFVPALNRLVFGAESWWHEIKSPEELGDITDADIDGQFYVQYLKQIGKKNEV